MAAQIHDLGGQRVLLIAEHGAPLESERDATDLIGEAIGAEAHCIAVPAARFSADFFQLSTRKAGLFIQKFANYRFHLAILGDIDAHLARSQALNDFVRESNKGQVVTFVQDLDALAARLGVAAPRGACE
jgi:hypothetical protein